MTPKQQYLAFITALFLIGGVIMVALTTFTALGIVLLILAFLFALLGTAE